MPERIRHCNEQAWSQRVAAAAMDARNFARFAVESHERMVVCRAKCAAGLAGRIGEAVTLREGESTEWTDDFVPPPWLARALADRGGRR